MLNQVVLVGRLTKDPEVKELENEKSVSNISLAVQRPFKNEEGVYETDFIDCTIWNNVALATREYCHKGDIVGVKGRLQTNSYEDKETGKKITTLNMVAEKVTFLSNKSKDEPEEER